MCRWAKMSQVLITSAEWRHSHVCERCWCLQQSAWLHLLIKVCACVTKTDRGIWKGEKKRAQVRVCVCLTFKSVTPTEFSSSCLRSDADTPTANLLSLLPRAKVRVSLRRAGLREKKKKEVEAFWHNWSDSKLMAVNKLALWVDVQCSGDASPLCVAASSDIQSSHNLPISVAIFSLMSLYSPLYTGQPVASLGGFNINWVWAAPQGCLIAL